MIDLVQLAKSRYRVLPVKAGKRPSVRLVDGALQFYVPQRVVGATFLGVYPCHAALPSPDAPGLKCGDYAFISNCRQLIQLT